MKLICPRSPWRMQKLNLGASALECESGATHERQSSTALRAVMDAVRRQRPRAEGRHFASVALARLACLLCCALLQTGTGFVGHLPRGPSTAAARAAAAPGRHHQRSWSSTSRTSHQREKLRQSIVSSAGEPRTSNTFARFRSSVDVRSNRVESALVEMVGAAATSSARRGSSSTSLAASTAGPELASDAPAKMPKKRGRPRKVPLVEPDDEVVPNAMSNAQKDIAEAATAGRAAAAAAASQDDAAVRTSTTASTTAAAVVEREDVEASIREEGAPTVVTSKGFVPLEDDLDGGDDEEEEEEEEGELLGQVGEGGEEEGSEEEEGEDGTKAKRAAKGKKAKGKGGKEDTAIAEEEARQDKQAADIKVRSVFQRRELSYTYRAAFNTSSK